MFISRAWAGHFTPDTGNTGGGDTLLIILGPALRCASFMLLRRRCVAYSRVGPTRRTAQCLDRLKQALTERLHDPEADVVILR